MAVTGRYLFTQPETILAILSVVAIYFTFHLGAESTSDVLLKMIHFTSFSVYVGMSFWVTFVAGLAMYRIIPRHLFSQVQSVLFPKFVRYCMIFSSFSLISYYLLVKSTSNGLPLKKLSGLIISVLGSVLSCILINPLVDAIARRNEVEKAEKVGQGIGNDNEGCKKLLDTNEQYATLYNRVVKLHGASALVNLICLVGITLHLLVLSYNVKIE